MARIAKADVNAALQVAAQTIKRADLANDGRVSRAEMKAALKNFDISPTEKKLVDVFFKFIDHRDFRAGAQVTLKDIDRAVAYAKEHMVAKYDLNNDGLSAAEIKKMSFTGQTAVALAKELKAAAAGKTALDEPSFNEFLTKVKVDSKVKITDPAKVPADLAKQIITATNQASYDVKTLAEAFDAVDQGEFNIFQATDKKTGQKYLAIEFGAGDNSYGGIFKAGSQTVAARIHDGDLEVK